MEKDNRKDNLPKLGPDTLSRLLKRKPKHGTPMTARKAQALCEKVRLGDLNALDKLVDAYLYLVDLVALQNEGQGLPFEDLKQVGTIGLMKAATRFDNKKGVNFKTYAIWWIRQSMLKAVHEQARMELVPDVLMTQIWDISKGFDYDEVRNDREPSNREISDLLKLQIDHIAKIHGNNNGLFNEGRLSA